MAKSTIGAELKIDSVKLKGAAHVLRALNHPLRQSILRLLHKSQSVDVTSIYKRLKLEQSVTSQHLGILRAAGFVVTQRDGQRILYSVNYQRIEDVQKAAYTLTRPA